MMVPGAHCAHAAELANMPNNSHTLRRIIRALIMLPHPP